MKKGVLLIISILVLIISFFISSNITYGVNRTVGWAWDLTNYRFWIGCFFSLLILLIVLVLIVFISKLIIKKIKARKII